MGIWEKTKNMFNAMLMPDDVGDDEATIKKAKEIEKEQTGRINELLKQMETKTKNYKNAIKVDGNKSIVNNVLHEGGKKLERKIKEQKEQDEEREN